MSVYNDIALKIIKEQEFLLGPIAWLEAGKVTGLKVIDRKNGMIAIDPNADNSQLIDDLVERFEALFGRTGREVCKGAVGALIAKLEPAAIPSALR